MDREALTARLTWDVIEPALKTVPRTVLLAGRDPRRDCVLGGGRLHHHQRRHDRRTCSTTSPGERRDGTAADLADVTRLCDAPRRDRRPLAVAASPATSTADVLPLVTQAIMVRNTTKHVQDEVRTPEMVEPILEIYEAACGRAAHASARTSRSPTAPSRRCSTTGR